jgi:HD-like signal output (HDOD) protein
MAIMQNSGVHSHLKPQTNRKYRILFVDDIRTLLLSMERQLRSQRDQWEMVFVNSAAEALERLEKESFDIIISDVVMPKMNGVELLEIVKERYPTMIRFILSGHADHQTLIQSVGATHQFMAKPCNRDVLTKAIARTLALRNLFSDQNLKEIVKDATSVPSLPELYQELTAELASPSGTAERIAQIISKDITISAKVLQLVNSAFFGLSRNIESISQAVTLLGAETINSIVLTTSVFNKFDDSLVDRFNIHKIYNHSISVGAMAARIVRHAGLDKQTTEETLLAGMMHDLGLLVLINSDCDAWKQLYLERGQHDKPLHIQERERINITHAEVGAYVLGLWGLPDTIIESVAFHHEPAHGTEEKFDPVAAVYLADHFSNALDDPAQAIKEMDPTYIEALGLKDKLKELSDLFNAS